METSQLSLIWQLLFWLGLLASCPFWFLFAKTLIKMTMNRFFPKRFVKVIYRRIDGKTINCTLDLKDDTPLVEQMQKSACYVENAK